MVKTNINRSINNASEAKGFLCELILNDESYHPDDSAHDIIWGSAVVSSDECDKLDSLMESVHEHMDDPCDFILTVTGNVKLKEPELGEEGIVFRVTNYNEVTDRVYITPVYGIDLSIPNEELVSFNDIEII